MYRQSPSRNQRSKGINVRHVLQICLLLAVCFWLIYQVKHSHDKKKEFDEKDAKNSLNTPGGNRILNLGRKDLNPQVEGTAKKNVKNDEEAAGEEVDNKHEEEEQEEDSKTEEKEDEGRGGGDDEIDEHDQEKTDMEVDREEDLIDEEKDREEGDEKETEENDVEDNDGQMEDESSSEDHDRDGGARNTHEAREEQYKADDASSAVTHDTQTISTENESVENLNENGEANIVNQNNKLNNTEEINVGQNSTELKVEDGETAENGNSLDATVNEEKGSEILPSTITRESNDHPELSNNSTEVSTEFPSLSLPNGTENTFDSTQTRSATEGGTTSEEGLNLQTIALKQANNSSIAFDNNQSDSNSSIYIATENAEAPPGESSNSSTNKDFVVSGNILRSNASAEAEYSSGNSNEKSDTSNRRDGTDESSGSSEMQNADEVQHDPIDSSIRLEEKEVLTDLETLPEIRTEGSNSEYTAAE